jgi:hypothetical protein
MVLGKSGRITAESDHEGVAISLFVIHYIIAASFIDGGNWITQRKPLIFHKSLINFIT